MICVYDQRLLVQLAAQVSDLHASSDPVSDRRASFDPFSVARFSNAHASVAQRTQASARQDLSDPRPSPRQTQAKREGWATKVRALWVLSGTASTRACR